MMDETASEIETERKSFTRDTCFRKYGSKNYGFHNNDTNRKPFKRSGVNTRNNGKRKKFDVGNRLKESDIGVTEFIGEHTGFFALIKERYSDFHVNEIDLNGQIAKLTNQAIPAKPENKQSIEDLKQLVSETIWNQLETLKNTESLNSIDIDVTNIDKNERRAIHEIARKMKNVTSRTIDVQGKKLMKLLKMDDDFRFYFDKGINWKKREGDYCYFVLHKVNMDTMDALNQMARNLRIKPDRFNYAGTKDRRAWTSQWISLKKIEPSEILRAGKAIRGAYVGNFKFAKEPLKLGMLNGNYFRIALRNVTGTDQEIENAMASLRNKGFINYYGLQRFGTIAAIPTHEIGKMLLQGKWHEAIELILKPREGEQDEDLAEARKIYEETKDPFAAYTKIRRSDKIEARLLKGLQISGNRNPQGALDAIPRNIRLMYIHSYQSFVWNHMVSRRIKEFGPNPVVGDIVYENKRIVENDTEDIAQTLDESNDVSLYSKNDKDKSSIDIKNNKKMEQFTSEFTNDEGVDSIKNITNATENTLKIEKNPNENDEKEDQEEIHNLPPVKVLTEQNLSDYTLADVVMPQPGWKVIYPQYAKPWFDEFLAKDELTTELKQKNKKYSLGGAYRKILEIPQDLSWKVVHYKDKDDTLISSDIQEMRKVNLVEDETGKKTALIIGMTLRSSTYATMALREILKHDTSPQTQAAHSAACNTESQNVKEINATSIEIV